MWKHTSESSQGTEAVRNPFWLEEKNFEKVWRGGRELEKTVKDAVWTCPFRKLYISEIFKEMFTEEHTNSMCRMDRKVEKLSGLSLGSS